MRKLSELNADELCDALIEIMPALSDILEDAEVVSAFRLGGGSDAEKGVRRIAAAVPVMLKRHRESVYKVLSALNGRSVEEIRRDSGLKMAADIMELLKDEDMPVFFN